MIEHLAQVAGTFVLSASFAIVAIALLRPLLARRFGAVAALMLWWVLPAALITVFLPKEVVHQWTIAPAFPGLAAPARVLSNEESISWMPIVAVTWIVGSIAMAAWYAWLQYRFARLIAWRGSRGILPPLEAPAAVGVLWPRLALPQDFATQFDATERRLVLLHERIHMHRRDGAANLLMATLTVLQWFNPLVHWASRTLRRDQESACDAIVIARHPGAVQQYAGALLKALPETRVAPLACSWHRTHPLVERIRMLKIHRDLKPRTRIATALVVACATLVTALAYAAKPENPVEAKTAETSQASAPGEGVLFKVVFMKDGKVVSSPSALGKFGQELAIEIAQTMRVEAVAGTPDENHRAPTAVKFYLFQAGEMRLIQQMSMTAVLSATPSFEYSVPETPYRFVVMPRLAKLPQSKG